MPSLLALASARELFYIGLDDRLMAVPIRFDTTRRAVIAGASQPLFPTRVGGAVTVAQQQYAVTPDGQRFVMNVVEPRYADHAAAELGRPLNGAVATPNPLRFPAPSCLAVCQFMA